MGGGGARAARRPMAAATASGPAHSPSRPPSAGAAPRARARQRARRSRGRARDGGGGPRGGRALGTEAGAGKPGRGGGRTAARSGAGSPGNQPGCRGLSGKVTAKRPLGPLRCLPGLPFALTHLVGAQVLPERSCPPDKPGVHKWDRPPLFTASQTRIGWKNSLRSSSPTYDRRPPSQANHGTECRIQSFLKNLQG